MADILVLGILLAAVGAAVLYIIREKKKGTRCIGCPAAGHCSKRGCSSLKDGKGKSDEE